MRITKRLLIIACILTLIISSLPLIAYAHGAVFEQKMVGENTLRVTLKWSNSSEAGTINIVSAAPHGKYIDIAYEVRTDGKGTQSMDFDTRGILMPACIKLYNIKDYDSPTFPDIKDNYAGEYIHHLHDAGIVNGAPNGTFSPNSSVTRAEFMTMMVKALKLEGTATNTQGFTDLNNHWAKNTMLLAAKNGLIAGYPDKTIRPDGKITLAEVCAVISRGFTIKTSNNGIYSGLKQGEWYSNYVKKMFDSGIITTNDNLYKYQFNEKSNLSRGNCAMMISRAMTTY